MTDSDLFRNPGLGSLLQYHLKFERVVWRVLEFAILWLRSGFLRLLSVFRCVQVLSGIHAPRNARLESSVDGPWRLGFRASVFVCVLMYTAPPHRMSVQFGLLRDIPFETCKVRMQPQHLIVLTSSSKPYINPQKVGKRMAEHTKLSLFYILLASRQSLHITCKPKTIACRVPV